MELIRTGCPPSLALPGPPAPRKNMRAGRGVVSVTVSLSVWPSGPRATRTARDRSPDTRDARVSRDTATRETDRAARQARYGATRAIAIKHQSAGRPARRPPAEQNNLACGPIGISFIPYAVLEFACHEQRHGRLSQKFAALQRQAQSVLAWLIVPW